MSVNQRSPGQPGEPRPGGALAGLPMPVLLVDEAGAIRFANQEAEALFDYLAADLVGKPIGQLLWSLPPEEHPYGVADLGLSGSHPLLGDGREALGLRRAEGRFAVLVSARQVVEQGEPCYAVAVRDVSAFQRHDAARRATDERVRRLLETARVIPWEADVASNQFTYVGPQAEEILGYPVEAWYAQDFWPQHMHPEDREAAVRLCAAATRRETHYEFEYRMIAADGRIVWIHDIVVVARWRGVPQLISGYMLDITERKRAEEERVRLLDEAQAAVRVRDEFMQVAAHELRTPLTPLRLHLQNLLRIMDRDRDRDRDRDWDRDRAQGRERASVPASYRRQVEVALRQLERLGNLVEKLLDVTRIRQGRFVLDLGRCDLGEVVREVTASFAGVLEHARSSLYVDAGAAVVGRWDRVRLEQVVTNLLSNAVKYGAGKPIEVRVSATDGKAQLSVRDHGIGIAAADQERIFECFERAVPITRYGGLGLGLYVARRAVESHGGTIRVESEPGQGATFIVELPLEPPGPEGA